jgi:hypothetical protein
LFFLFQINITAEAVVRAANFGSTQVLGGVLRNETDLLYLNNKTGRTLSHVHL